MSALQSFHTNLLYSYTYDSGVVRETKLRRKKFSLCIFSYSLNSNSMIVNGYDADMQQRDQLPTDFKGKYLHLKNFIYFECDFHLIIFIVFYSFVCEIFQTLQTESFLCYVCFRYMGYMVPRIILVGQRDVKAWIKISYI